MLQNTLPAYLYQQYAADDNLQAVIAAYNAATQTIVSAFASQNLAYYPALSAPLLQWVAEGLYGTQETALASPITPATGPLNTVMLNTTLLNTGTPASETYYNITDDIFKRILTWNLYKGDGKRFCMRWLKRRIARFIFGVDGTDPQFINNPSMVPGVNVGTETTSAISVVVSDHTLTVTLDQALISAQTQLTPGILTFFSLAFTSGVLDLPLQYSYAVDIVTNLTASISPPTATVVGSASSLTTPPVTVSLSGGSGEYTFAWSFFSGGTGITIGSATAATTDFSGSGLAVGEGLSGIAQCVVTDTITSNTATAYVNVVIERAAALSATASPTSLSATGASTSIETGASTVTASGGVGGYTYAWSFISGGADMVILNGATRSASFESTSALAAGDTATGTAQCLVTDSLGDTTTVDVDVSITRVSAVSATVSPGTASVEGASASETTNTVTVTPAGGGGVYTFSWAFSVGGTSITIGSPAAATTSFSGASLAAGTTRTGTATCTIKDQYGQSTTVNVTVSIERVSLVSASVSPTSQTSIELAASQTTGISTVTASGGSGSYTYAWVWSSGGSGIVINSPHSRSSSFTASGLTEGETVSGVAQCTITDTYGQTAIVTVSVTIRYGYLYQGTMVAGYVRTTIDPGDYIYTYGYISGDIGSISPTTDINDKTISNLDLIERTGSSTTTVYLSIVSSTDPGQDYFSTITISPQTTETYTSAEATYSYSGGVATWAWTDIYDFTDGDSYSVILST